MKNYKELDYEANQMKNVAKDELSNLLKSKKQFDNQKMSVSRRKFSMSKTINTLTALLLVALLIYILIMTPYVFFNGYPY